MIWAADLMVPNMLYLLFELHPAITKPITSRDTIANKKNNAVPMPDPLHVGPRGRTAKPANTLAKMIIGARRNRMPSALAGTMSSFWMSFNKSAIDCAKP